MFFRSMVSSVRAHTPVRPVSTDDRIHSCFKVVSPSNLEFNFQVFIAFNFISMASSHGPIHIPVVNHLERFLLLHSSYLIILHNF